MYRQQEKIKDELESVQHLLANSVHEGLGCNYELVSKEKSSRDAYDDLINKQELYWAQRAKDRWMVLGDRNTSYFYKVASVRARRNRIVCLKNESGELVTNYVGIQSMFVPYFQNWFEGTFCKNGMEPVLACF